LKHVQLKLDRATEYQSTHQKQLEKQVKLAKNFSTALKGSGFRDATYYQTRLCSMYARAAVLGDKDALMECRHVCMGRTKLSLSTDHSSSNCPCRASGSLLSQERQLKESDPPQPKPPKPSDSLRATLKSLKDKINATKTKYWSEPEKWKPKMDGLDRDEATLFNATLSDFQDRSAARVCNVSRRLVRALAAVSHAWPRVCHGPSPPPVRVEQTRPRSRRMRQTSTDELCLLARGKLVPWSSSTVLPKAARPLLLLRRVTAWATVLARALVAWTTDRGHCIFCVCVCACVRARAALTVRAGCACVACCKLRRATLPHTFPFLAVPSSVYACADERCCSTYCNLSATWR